MTIRARQIEPMVELGAVVHRDVRNDGSDPAPGPEGEI